MFERPYHQRIALVLQALDGSLLRENGCLFGGGTSIALRYGEYRESVDIDFLVSDLGATEAYGSSPPARKASRRSRPVVSRRSSRCER